MVISRFRNVGDFFFRVCEDLLPSKEGQCLGLGVEYCLRVNRNTATTRSCTTYLVSAESVMTSQVSYQKLIKILLVILVYR